jgi:hypothetical protein
MYRGYYSPAYRVGYPYGGGGYPYGGYPYGGGGYPYGGGGYPYGGTYINGYQSQFGYQSFINTGNAGNVNQIYSPYAIY